MSAKTFVDTNVLIYAHDLDTGGRRDRARMCCGSCGVSERGPEHAGAPGVLRQRHAQDRLAAAEAVARAVVDSYALWCVETTPAEIEVAFRIEDEARIGFWDALIVAAARKAGCVRKRPGSW